MIVQENGTDVTLTAGLDNWSGADADLAALKTLAFYNTASNWTNTLTPPPPYPIQWDIDDPDGVWKICDGEGLPFLRWQGILCDGETGIANYESGSTNYVVYPNPANDVLNFSIETPFEIADLQGRTLLKSDKAVKSVNVSGLPSGIYLVRLTTESGNMVVKIIKK